jgi:hypothetical protein
MAQSLQNTINWARAASGNYLSQTIGTGNEPAITNANNVKSLILAMPWPWNRAKASFTTTIGIQDYVVEDLTQWGWLESASTQPCATVTEVAGSGTTATITAANAFNQGDTVTITGLTNTAFNVTNAPILTATSSQFTFASTTSLSATADSGLALSGTIFAIPDVFNSKPLDVTSQQQRPHTIGVQMNDDSGDITFRLMGAPDATYNIVLNYQQSCVLFTALSGAGGTWAPIPDYYGFIYNRGFLGECLGPVNAGRAQAEKHGFIMALMAVAEGLELADKAIFMSSYLNIDAQTAANMLDVQQGVAAKAQQ